MLPGWQVAILPSLRGWPAGTSRIFLERWPHILDRGQVSGAWQIFTAGLPRHSRTTENFSVRLSKTAGLGQLNSPGHPAG